MLAKFLVALSATLAGAPSLVSAAGNANGNANERVLGVYIFHRHGDRTAKAWAPVTLTALGAAEVFSSADFYRQRYVQPDAALRISGLADTLTLSQLSITAPKDAVLYNSALTFTQGMYPPAGQKESLANGSQVEAPLGGYQYVPVDAISNAATANKAESQGWLQGSSGCDKSVASSNSYLSTPAYKETYNDTLSFYQRLLPVINSTYGADAATFKNGYTIFDYINVAKIHNATIPSGNLVDNETLFRLYTLASTHEWNLAFNASEPVRAIAGQVLAGQVLDSFQDIVGDATSTSSLPKTTPIPKLNVQFGAYGTFMAFFGLAQLPAASPSFYGICDYASSMTFELFTTSTANRLSPDDLSVRFLFANGSAANNQLGQYPLFGQSQLSLPWNDFVTAMGKIAVTNTQQWCDLCGGTSSTCASSASNGPSTQSSDSGSGGVSRPVAGVIGALVTLVVILTLQAAVMLLGGLRLVKKPASRGIHGGPEAGVAKVQ
ncbi:Histidine phosphatase superfamily, clade-2 [Moelleriella libera RCEF 2490]|uniref:Histidine phosphatase superfamily, clade-2 n=1 Tax=Moelleriella libera RCEF 2490 TaxID=1081109 RepID=A0A166UMN5_9HYPO|nr:Histidine phosphatase superfamily, clade-2 [Moelleriella libera RCEF 2490]